MKATALVALLLQPSAGVAVVRHAPVTMMGTRPRKSVAVNRLARRNYEILDEFEAGRCDCDETRIEAGRQYCHKWSCWQEEYSKCTRGKFVSLKGPESASLTDGSRSLRWGCCYC